MKTINNIIVAFVLFCATGALADGLDAPKGDVLLTVSGAIDVTNVGETAQFDIDMLREMETTSFTTSTPWTDGPVTFTGVALKDLVDALDITAGTLAATAVNDYAVDIPISDAVEDGPIVAYLRNGETMSVRNKGPLWIVYPYDAREDYQSEVIYSRSIWQLDRIVASR